MAWNFLTIIPLGKQFDFEMDKFSKSIALYPLVGAILALILVVVGLTCKGIVPDIHLHVILFALWVILTGAIHLDGVADSIDGLYVEKKRVLEVMKDPHIGGMGMIFTFIFLALKLSSFIYLDNLYYLIPIMAFSRYNALYAIYNFAYVSSGFSKGVQEHFERKDFIGSSLAIILLALLIPNGIYLLLGSLVTLYAIKWLFYKKIDGFSGDVYGLSIEMSELVMLNVLIILC